VYWRIIKYCYDMFRYYSSSCCFSFFFYYLDGNFKCKCVDKCLRNCFLMERMNE
jgi:hypothetical protein